MQLRTLALAALLAACVGPRPALAATITVKGSDTMVILAQKWAEVYMARNPSVNIQVTGGGSGTGIAALQNQTTDLCNSSRSMRPSEIAGCIKAFARRPTEYAVALDGLSVFVHASNPVKELTLDHVRLIFTGRITRWNEVGGPAAPIALYSRENSSGTYEFFKDRVLAGADFSPKVQSMPGTAAVLEAVVKDPNGVGYGGAAYVKNARFLALRRDDSSPAIELNEATVVKGEYPIWRRLYIYVNPAVDHGPVSAYLKWIRSDDGQAVVKDIGYFPLPPQYRSPGR